MKIISIRENMLVSVTELLQKKEIALYKTSNDFEIYEIKNSDIKIALISNDTHYFTRQEKEIEYNTHVFNQLWQGDKLNTKTIIQLYNLNVFM